jgi:hypothetical protein
VGRAEASERWQGVGRAVASGGRVLGGPRRVEAGCGAVYPSCLAAYPCTLLAGGGLGYGAGGWRASAPPAADLGAEGAPWPVREGVLRSVRERAPRPARVVRAGGGAAARACA